MNNNQLEAALTDQSLASSLLECLQELKHGLRHPRTVATAICYHLHGHWTHYKTPRGDELLHHLFRTWPEGSGSAHYPVPRPDGATDYGGIIFYQLYGFEGRWTGKYGESRRRLLDWMIQTLEEQSIHIG